MSASAPSETADPAPEPNRAVSASPGLQDEYQVRLASFQGPLDLLLYLIRRAEVAIEDIPIAQITGQYFQFLKQLDRIDIDVAGEFLVMAATLIEIKSRTLAPRPEGDESDSGPSAEVGGDPRAELVQQLLAYQRYRNAAAELDRLRHEFAHRWTARVRAADEDAAGEADEEPLELELEDAHILDLFETYERIISSIDITRLGQHTVEYDDTPITLHQADLVDRLERSATRSLTLRSVFLGRTRGEMIGLFLATLELARQRKILIRQEAIDGELELTLNPDDDGVMSFEGDKAAAPRGREDAETLPERR